MDQLSRRERARRRRAQRGNAVLIVVMVAMLLSAVGVFAVRNISLVDRAVGYGRQASQTAALAELGSTAAVAYLAALNRDSVTTTATNPALQCVANANPPLGQASTCFPFRGTDMETLALANNGVRLLEPQVGTTPGTEAGSLGAAANMQGLVDVELTDIQEAPIYLKGRSLADKPLDATVTTRARIIPLQAGGNPCGAAVSSMTVKKVMRAHAIF